MAIIETLHYQPATITAIISETTRTKTFRLAPARPTNYLAGQHIIVKVALPDGFKTSRHYSLSSAPSSGHYDISVARAHDGVVSSWFFDAAKVGDVIEITQPLGSMHWQPDQPDNILLIGGGIGVAPLVGIMREHQALSHPSLMTLVYSARNYDELCFKKELFDGHSERIVATLVESVPGDWQGHSGVVTASILEPLILADQLYYVCGPYGFVQHVQSILVGLSIPPSKIKIENFTLQ